MWGSVSLPVLTSRAAPREMLAKPSPLGRPSILKERNMNRSCEMFKFVLDTQAFPRAPPIGSLKRREYGNTAREGHSPG